MVMNNKFSLPKIVLLSLLFGVATSVILPTLVSILFSILPGLLFAACVVGGWWIIRRLQGVSREQAKSELHSAQQDTLGRLQKFATDTSRAGQAALRAFHEEIRK